jgi:hypothetical protein
MKTTLKFLTFFLLGVTTMYQANAHWTSKRPDGHAPIGVMADHKHAKGEWMLSYRHMSMDMDGVSIAPGYTMRPTDMSMDMNMFGAMYAPSDQFTWMLMANHIDNQMKMTNGMMTSQMQSKGLGDISISGLFDINSWDEEALIGTIGLGIPTGSIDEKKSGSTQRQPYAMQLGSGTLDIRPGITYLGQNEGYSWGAQIAAVIRTGTNDNNYSLGDRWNATAWIARKLSNNLSASIRLTGERIGSIDGSDSNIGMPMMSPANNTANSGGDMVSGSGGINYLFNNGHRLALEYQIPLDQDLDGIQMDRDNTVTLGWQYAW